MGCRRAGTRSGQANEIRECEHLFRSNCTGIVGTASAITSLTLSHFRNKSSPKAPEAWGDRLSPSRVSARRRASVRVLGAVANREPPISILLHLVRRRPASAALFKRVKDEDRAEAALLAAYGRDQLGAIAPAAPKPFDPFDLPHLIADDTDVPVND